MHNVGDFGCLLKSMADEDFFKISPLGFTFSTRNVLRLSTKPMFLCYLPIEKVSHGSVEKIMVEGGLPLEVFGHA